jgi:hypothetical protein
MSPKRPCTRPLPLLWTRGLRPAYRINRAPGSFQRRASKLYTECAGGPATLAQRIVRAKAVIRDKAIPYQVPVSQELPARLGAVLQVVYLVFNEGYSA